MLYTTGTTASPQLSSMDHTIAVNAESNRDGIKGGAGGDQSVEVISLEPRASVYLNFLSKEECEYLIKVAKPHLQRSRVNDSVTGKGVESSRRTSSSASLTRGRDNIIRDIEKRIAEWTRVPVDHGERLQVLHYQVGQKNDPHYDYFTNEINTRNSGPRMATVLMYLSDVEEGGETVFPKAKVNNRGLPCGKEGVSVKPKMGDALLFWNMKPDGSLDPLSKHGASPVIKGNKWACTKWIHVNKVKC